MRIPQRLVLSYAPLSLICIFAAFGFTSIALTFLALWLWWRSPRTITSFFAAIVAAILSLSPIAVDADLFGQSRSADNLALVASEIFPLFASSAVVLALRLVFRWRLVNIRDDGAQTMSASESRASIFDIAMLTVSVAFAAKIAFAAETLSLDGYLKAICSPRWKTPLLGQLVEVFPLLIITISVFRWTADKADGLRLRQWLTSLLVSLVIGGSIMIAVAWYCLQTDDGISQYVKGKIPTAVLWRVFSAVIFSHVFVVIMRRCGLRFAGGKIKHAQNASRPRRSWIPTLTISMSVLGFFICNAVWPYGVSTKKVTALDYGWPFVFKKEVGLPDVETQWLGYHWIFFNLVVAMLSTATLIAASTAWSRAFGWAFKNTRNKDVHLIRRLTGWIMAFAPVIISIFLVAGLVYQHHQQRAGRGSWLYIWSHFDLEPREMHRTPPLVHRLYWEWFPEHLQKALPWHCHREMAYVLPISRRRLEDPEEADRRLRRYLKPIDQFSDTVSFTASSDIRIPRPVLEKVTQSHNLTKFDYTGETSSGKRIRFAGTPFLTDVSINAGQFDLSFLSSSNVKRLVLTNIDPVLVPKLPTSLVELTIETTAKSGVLNLGDCPDLERLSISSSSPDTTVLLKRCSNLYHASFHGAFEHIDISSGSQLAELVVWDQAINRVSLSEDVSALDLKVLGADGNQPSQEIGEKSSFNWNSLVTGKLQLVNVQVNKSLLEPINEDLRLEELKMVGCSLGISDEAQKDQLAGLKFIQRLDLEKMTVNDRQLGLLLAMTPRLVELRCSAQLIRTLDTSKNPSLDRIFLFDSEGLDQCKLSARTPTRFWVGGSRSLFDFGAKEEFRILGSGFTQEIIQRLLDTKPKSVYYYGSELKVEQ
ncbi:MAG: hypothetical protein AAF664_18210 [Planctomycetota bacterium]